MDRFLTDLTNSLVKYEERLALAYEAAGMGVWDWDIKNDRIFWDHKMCRLFGIDEKEFIGGFDVLHNFVIPVDKDNLKKSIQDSLKNGSKFQCTFRVNVKNEIYQLTSKAKIIRDVDGNAVRMVGVTYKEEACPRSNFCEVREILKNNPNLDPQSIKVILDKSS